MGRLGQVTTNREDLRLTLEPQVTERQQLIAERDALISRIAEISDGISTALALADEKSVRVGQWLVTLVENSGRLTLDKHRLVELGVAPETITAASVRGQPSISLQVRTAAEG